MEGGEREKQKFFFENKKVFSKKFFQKSVFLTKSHLTDTFGELYFF